MGPTPPGTGLINIAFYAQSGDTSPNNYPPCYLIPTSINTTSSFIISAFIIPGIPVPEIIKSAF